MNTDKLQALQDAHSVLHSAYKAASERARDAQGEATRLRNLAPTGSPEQKRMQSRIFARPLAELIDTPAPALSVAGIDARYIRLIIAAQRRADALRLQAESQAPALRRSGLLIAKINEYAQYV